MTASTISMVKTLQLELPYPQGSGNHSVRHGGGRHYLTPEAKAYRAAILDIVNPRGKRVALTGPLKVDYLFAPPDLRVRDSCNALKVFKDALTLAGFWVDDSNRVLIDEHVRWTDPVPGGAIFITVSPFEKE